MPWAIHNLASQAVLTDANGTYSHNGIDRIPAPTPLHVEETREEAEAWRFAQPSDVPAHSRWNTLSGDVG